MSYRNRMRATPQTREVIDRHNRHAPPVTYPMLAKGWRERQAQREAEEAAQSGREIWADRLHGKIV